MKSITKLASPPDEGVFVEAGAVTDDEAVVMDYVEANEEPEEGESAEEEDNDEEAGCRR